MTEVTIALSSIVKTVKTNCTSLEDLVDRGHVTSVKAWSVEGS